MKYVIDTNTVFDYPFLLDREDVVVVSHVIREIEKIESQKCFGNESLKKRIREVKRYYDKNEELLTIDLNDYVWDLNDKYDKDYEDNKILKCCVVNDYGLLTKDRLLRAKARFYNIPVIKPEEVYENNSHLTYTGVIDFYYNELDKEDAIKLGNLYSGFSSTFSLVENQYVCVWDLNKPHYNEEDKIIGYEHIDNFVMKNGKVKKVYYDDVTSKHLGTIYPANAKQKLAFHMLQDKESTIKVIQGGFGVGKDFLMITHAIQMLQEHKVDKIIWVRNNVEVKDTNPIGFLPDGKMDKLLPFAMPLADHLGGVEGLTMFVENGKIQIEHLGFMRGRNIENAIIYVTEAENNTTEHIQLLIGRVGKGSQLWINGDLKQVDDKKFEVNSGLSAIKKLAGEKKFAIVTLDKVERSETARLADKLD